MQIAIRDFGPQDFEPVACLTQEVWGDGLEGQASELAGKAMVAAYLDDHAWGRVAVDAGGAVVGAILAGLRDTPHINAEDPEWPFPTLAGTLDEARSLDPDLPALLREQAAVEIREAEVTRELQATGAPESDATIQLLVLSERARGHHLGSTLLDAARAWFRSQGARGYFLMTDDECDYGFYDHEGLRRLKTDEITVSGSPFGLYAYGELLP